MEDIKYIVGKNLKTIRKNRKLTLENLSKITDVSTSMLGEIERGVTNPTITVLWKIANGLKIAFSELIKEDKPPISVVHQNEAAISIDGDGIKILSMMNFDPKKKIEIYYKTIEPAATHESDGHNEGIEEYILICEGIMNLEIDNENYTLSKGDIINFKANTYHCYKNESNSILSAYIILYYGDSDRTDIQ